MRFNARLHPYVLLLSGIAITARPLSSFAEQPDTIAQLQVNAVQNNSSDWGHWGPNPNVYSSWKSHSNRLIPVYSFGMNLRSVSGKRSLYRDQDAIEKLFGYLPEKTLNPNAGSSALCVRRWSLID